MKTIRIATTEDIVGEEIIEVLGVVEGSSIQTRHIGSHILAGLMTIVGGVVKGYVQAVNTARSQAMQRMLTKAEELGADAVVCVRYSTSQIMDGGAEILVYGTAVKLKR